MDAKKIKRKNKTIIQMKTVFIYIIVLFFKASCVQKESGSISNKKNRNSGNIFKSNTQTLEIMREYLYGCDILVSVYLFTKRRNLVYSLKSEITMVRKWFMCSDISGDTEFTFR